MYLTMKSGTVNEPFSEGTAPPHSHPHTHTTDPLEPEIRPPIFGTKKKV